MEDEELVENFAKQVGKNIKELRINKKIDDKRLTQEEVADILDTTVLTIQRLEKRRV